jgi:hypothetical protein
MSEETAQHHQKPRSEQKCTVANCKRPYRAKGFCVAHYRKWRHGEVEGTKSRYKICTKEGCRKPRAQGSLCAEHAGGAAAAA